MYIRSKRIGLEMLEREGAFCASFLNFLISLPCPTGRTPQVIDSVVTFIVCMPPLLFSTKPPPPPSMYSPEPSSFSLHQTIGAVETNTLAIVLLSPCSAGATRHTMWVIKFSYFREPDIRRFLPEALTADVQPILANETGRVSANTA